MKDDDLLAAIRDHVRDEHADDAALEALARGDTDSAEVRLLEQRAKDDPALAALLDASRPLDAGVAEAIEARVRPRPAAPARRSSVLAFLPRAAFYAMPLAAAAAMLVYVAQRQADPALPQLPAYAIAASSDQELRGPAQHETRLVVPASPEARFELLARPDTNAGQPIVAYVFAVRDGEPSPLDVDVEVAPGGTVRIRGRVRALDGARELRVVLGTARAFARFEDAVSRARSGASDSGALVLTVPIDRAAR